MLFFFFFGASTSRLLFSVHMPRYKYHPRIHSKIIVAVSMYVCVVEEVEFEDQVMNVSKLFSIKLVNGASKLYALFPSFSIKAPPLCSTIVVQ